MSEKRSLFDRIMGRKQEDKVQIEDAGPTRDPSEAIVKRVGLAMDVGSNREYIEPEFDLNAITGAYNTESYVRQAVDKYIEMMFKSGWDFIGKNTNAVNYIKQRFALIAEMTSTPTDQFLIEIAEDLVKYSNVTIAKVRDKQGLLNGMKLPVSVQGLGGEEPIVGYFPLNVTTMSVLRDKYGTVKGWQQTVDGNSKPVKFKGTDIVHIYYKKEKGKGFATPFLLPVLNDIRALRQAEETILKLIYRNLNPLLHLQVGTKELPGQQTEVDLARSEFENMDVEGGYVTNERVNLKAISADKIIDAEGYIKYFEERVFTGLGVSKLAMGRGDTANRSTGDNMSTEFGDRVKAFQKVMAIFVDELIVKELLMEGGFDPILNPDDDVDFVFKEIDVDSKIKAENHAIFKYEHGAITEDEMRAELGEDPISDRSKMFASIKASDEGAGTAKEPSTSDTDNRENPKNQHSNEDQVNKEDYKISINQKIEDLHRAVSIGIDDYIREKDEKAFDALSDSIRKAEEDICHIINDNLDGQNAEPYLRSVHKICSELYKDVTTTIEDMSGDQLEIVAHESFGGMSEVFQMRMNDIADRSYLDYEASVVQKEEVDK